MNKLSPSILAADFVNLERDIRALKTAGADYVHVDVMDGLFVPNISIGIPVVAAIRGITDLPLDVHLMIDRPIRYVERFCKAGADILKVFPGELSGPRFIKAIRGPLPYAQIMPTGGVNVDNAAEWIKAGAVALGAGSALTKGTHEEIVARAKAFLHNIREARA